jgi:ATP phosphoribosyltransferase
MLKLAIQKKGRLTTGTMDILKRGGLEFEEKSSGLINPCKNFPLELLLLRDEDIPEAVETGAADLGIVGGNILDEFLANNTKSSLAKRLSLPFSNCRLSIAVPMKTSFDTLGDLKNLKIDTSYPGVLKKFSDENNLKYLALLSYD